MTLILETSRDKAPLEDLRERCLKDPNSKLFMSLAEELRRRGCYGEAIDMCMRAKTVYPRYVSCRVLLGRCFVELGMREEARRELEGVLKLDRENVFSLRIMAEILRAQGDLNQAIDLYRALIRISPTDMDAQRRLAELVQLLEYSEDNEPGPCVPVSPLPEIESLPSVQESASRLAVQTLPRPRQSLERELRHSDISRFAEWISRHGHNE